MGIGTFNRKVEKFSYGLLTLVSAAAGSTLWGIVAFTEIFDLTPLAPILGCGILFVVSLLALRKWTGLDRVKRRKIYGSCYQRAEKRQLYPELPAIEHEPIRFRERA